MFLEEKDNIHPVMCVMVGSLLCGVSRLQELISQAAQILGSVDFLGNPMGLLNDVTEGMSELIKYGNVGGLIRNVTHGVSNSAAKVRPCLPVYTRLPLFRLCLPYYITLFLYFGCGIVVLYCTGVCSIACRNLILRSHVLNINFLLLCVCQFAGTLSDGLGKTMDNRHQSEREYIRYHGATSGEHLVAGIHGLAHGTTWEQHGNIPVSG